MAEESRVEDLISKISGDAVEPEEPQSRIEELLFNIIDNGAGGTGGSTFTTLTLSDTDKVELDKLETGIYIAGNDGNLYWTDSNELKSMNVFKNSLITANKINESQWESTIVSNTGIYYYTNQFGDGVNLVDNLGFNVLSLSALGEIISYIGDGDLFLADDGTYKTVTINNLPDNSVGGDTIRNGVITINKLTSNLQDLINGKQNTLTAGAGITIENGVISVSYPDGDSEVYGS